MTQPRVIFDPHWRTVAELFSPQALAAFQNSYDVIWGRDAPIPHDVLHGALPGASAYIAAAPVVDQAFLDAAQDLKLVVEVSGAFPDSIDYRACAERGVEVLSCAPGFRNSVAEMGVAMALAGGRGLVTEHEAFRQGREGWLQDNPETDFSLYGAEIGFVGFGQIAREIHRLIAPFRPTVSIYDPWLPQSIIDQEQVSSETLDEVLKRARCLFVTAAPTAENRALLSAEKLALMPDNAVLVLLSRAHLVDFDAVTAEAATGRLRVATDVFPTEPLAQDHPIRSAKNAILSPHRAAAVRGGRHLIGDMILDDLNALFSGQNQRRLSRADLSRIDLVTGVGDARKGTQMVTTRKL